MGREPLEGHVESRARLFLDDVGEILGNEMRQEEAVVQLGSPSRKPLRRIRLAPESGHQRAQQHLLHQTHARMRGHFKSAHFEQSEPSAAAVGRVQLVDAKFSSMRIAGHIDQEISEQPIDEPRGDWASGFRELPERDLELVQRIVARFVHARRLRGRAR